MKKKAKQLTSALELANVVRGAAPIEAGILDIDMRRAQPVKVNKNLALAALKKLNTPKTRRIAAAVAGVVAVSAAAQGVSRYQFYRSAVGREMKKQLAPLQEQISALQASVDALRAENAALRGETLPTVDVTPKQRRRGK